MAPSLNDIILNGTMLENFYGRSLVEIEYPKPNTGPALKLLGNNAKKITVLVNNHDCAFLPDEQLSFLSKMLAACKMNTGDVAIVNLAGGPGIGEVMEQLSPEKIIAFGPHPDPATPLFTIGRFHDAALLQAPGLDELSRDSDEAKMLKGKLWTCLKNLFEL